MITAHQTDTGNWVVADNGTWLPGIFDCRTTAEKAATLPDGVLADLNRAICRIDGEDRAITEDDLPHA